MSYPDIPQRASTSRDGIPSYAAVKNPSAQTIADVTGLDLQRSNQLLEQSGGDVQAALARYYEGQNAATAAPVARPSSSANAHTLPVAHVVVANPYAGRPLPAPPRKKGCSTFSIFLSFLVTLLILAGIGVGVYFYLKYNTTLLGGSPTSSGTTVSGGGSVFVQTDAPTCIGCTRAPTLPPNQRFLIDLQYQTNVTAAQQQLFENAKARWEKVIYTTVGFESPISISKGSVYCGVTFTKDVTVQNILIFVSVSYIDGVGKTLGQAGPCAMVSGNSRIGQMQFDSADIDNMIQVGTANSVILHEMAHTFGFGVSTFWDNLNMITPSASPTPWYYLKSGGINGLAASGGSGQPVIEDNGVTGTTRAHWKETTYTTELMTGYISESAAPMSKMTIGSIGDLGYPVDLTQSDSYTVSSGRRLRDPNAQPYGNCILDMEIKEIPEYIPTKTPTVVGQTEQASLEAEDEDTLAPSFMINGKHFGTRM